MAVLTGAGSSKHPKHTPDDSRLQRSGRAIQPFDSGSVLGTFALHIAYDREGTWLLLFRDWLLFLITIGYLGSKSSIVHRFHSSLVLYSAKQLVIIMSARGTPLVISPLCYARGTLRVEKAAGKKLVGDRDKERSESPQLWWKGSK